MDASQMFLTRHERLHAHVLVLTAGLSDEQVRRPVSPGANPLAWLLWHIARGEDGAVNLMICDTAEVLDEQWLTRLNVTRRDVGTGMTIDEVLDLSARMDLPALMDYWEAVGQRTRELVSSLRPADLDDVPTPARLHDAVAHLVPGPPGPRLEELWRNTSKGHLLVWLPLTHNYEHVGQAEFIRGLLGNAGRF